MAIITVQTVSGEVGADIAFATCAGGGDTIDLNRAAMIVIDNADAAAKTVTFTPANTTVTDATNGVLTRAPIVVTVPATTRRVLKMPPPLFADVNGRVSVTYSAVTSLKIAAVVLP
jgi:hypothetical protein